MFVPLVLPRIEEWRYPTCLRVDAGQIGALFQVTVPARECQIVGLGLSAGLPGNDVLNVERAPERRLWQLAILTPISSAAPNVKR
jgi:hypothetical protein